MKSKNVVIKGKPLSSNRFIVGRAVATKNRCYYFSGDSKTDEQSLRYL